MGQKRTASEARQGSNNSFRRNERKEKNDRHHAKPRAKDNTRGRKPAETTKANLVFQPRPDWHAAELPAITLPEQFSPPPRHVLEELHQYADTLLEADNKTYGSKNLSADSSHKFLSTIMASGTLEDKVSALTLLIQESPLHTMKAFEQLLGLSKKKSRNQALMAMSALKDLLGQGVVLPPERKLRTFTKQPALLGAFSGANSNWKTGDRLPPGVESIHLIYWAYEDWLKREYFEILKILEGWCNDELQYSRSRAITFTWELLKEKPEQEENLLRLLINKVGDTDKKIASRASYLLLQLQVTHPVMKGVIINAIESELLFRPGQSWHAKYYAIITLNQTILNTREHEIANKLLEIYFSMFLGLLKSPKEKAAEHATGANGIVQGGGGVPGKKAAQKAKQKAKSDETAGKSEGELKEKIVAQVLTGVNRAFPYAKTDDAKFEGQLDTIFRVTHSSNFNTSIQALVLIQQISSTKHYSADRFYRTLYESLLDPRLLTSSKQIMYLNLLYKALKTDVSIKRVKAFVKRLLQVVTLHEAPFVCGVLYLISELQTVFPSIKTMLSTPELGDDDEEEHFVDAPEEGEGDKVGEEKETRTATQEVDPKSRYDGRKRDPEHSNADMSCLWELTQFPNHFHPSISLFANRLLYGGAMPPKPDPTLHTLMHFLDRFVYRNAKSKVTGKGVSIMQPMAGAATSDLLIKGRDGAKREAPLNSEEFWRKKAEDVDADEVFFHQYFEKSGKSKTKKEKKAEAKEDAEGSEGEDEIWKALVQSRPEIEGDDEIDDEDLSELDELMGAGEDVDDEDVDMDGGVEINMDDVEDSDEEDAEAGAEQQESDDDGFDAAELEDADEEAFMGSDDEVPSDFEGLDEGEEKKTKDGKDDGRKNKKRKLKHLPMFASADDYAKLLQDEESDY
ncbi:CBF-domain-containing protein [Saccharata proteae CBS 121410]|uniref:CBF-domain-containing protein n=1 Tax=Saccharata proteae CBS 121410 TaxID=1314787 RepID=A0A9P4HQK5_9PEZI|nr:CBF-domain-containing protein [Saccharata proteae CBS 121410]